MKALSTKSRTAFAVITILFLVIFSSCNQLQNNKTMNPSGFAIQRGVNLSHWLSQDFGWEPKYQYIKEDDIKFISSIGYDHVRIPIDEKEMWDSIGNPNKTAFQYLTGCLEWCKKYKLQVIVDMHVLKSHHFNAGNEGKINSLWTDAAAQNHFIDLWIYLSGILHEYPNNMLAYEILNEAVAPTHDDWNNLLNKVVAAIRKLEPERVIVIGANMWQIAPNIQYLKLPENDKNIILSFHTYTPILFTHHLADWVSFKNFSGSVHYPGRVISDEDFKKNYKITIPEEDYLFTECTDTFNKQRLFEVFKSGLEFAKSKNLQLYCGEFGSLPTVDRKDRLQYYSDMISDMEENNIAWCNWEYKGDFGIFFFDREKLVSTEPDYELIKVLLKYKH
jgi:endoglucanase